MVDETHEASTERMVSESFKKFPAQVTRPLRGVLVKRAYNNMPLVGGFRQQ